MGFLVVVEEGPSSFGAHVPDLPGCVAVGATREEVLASIEEAIQLHIEDIKASGLPVPQAVSSMATVEVAVN